MGVFDYKDGFRPRDQSVSTKMKYETEAKHWADAFKSQMNNKPANFSASFANVGLVVGLFFNLVLIVILSLTSIFKWIIKSTSKSEVETNTTSLPEIDFTIEDFIKKSRKQKNL